MTAIQRAVVDDLGNINVHGRSGLEIVLKVKSKEGAFLDISAWALFFEVGGWLRTAWGAGDDAFSRKLSVTRAQIGTLPLKAALDFAVHNETTSTPHPLWSGRLIAYGFSAAPAGAPAVDPGPTNWSGATVTVELGDPVPVVVVTYEGATGPAGAPAFTHTQSSASTDWTVNHNLGFRPTVTVLTAGGVEAEAHVVHTSTTQLHVYLAAPTTGSVRCN